ncbi:phosphoribosyltransferase [Legionella spiritensis]|uniref:Phosphoribosyltransferase n=1 Tax=Legionella spiritensis TaxID=452 RepID=A0A0W0YXY5_LEGSP|nr:phosphoribosyltransferase [Legionella spiritensis]KTD61757.1 phosphoribosyltransferase [Legionella spiritensis]SNV38583.1 phosphoribosyltransferase [Legionella spiritensis]
MDKYSNRREAGKFLAKQLSDYANDPDVIVLALPRGGVPVAYEVAKALSVPLDVYIVRKLGVPGHEELAMGALASGGTMIFNEEIINTLFISEDAINQVIQAEENELKRREQIYRGKRPFPDLSNKTIILVDDGIATGATMRAAINGLYKQNPARIIIAVPVAALSTYEEMSVLADSIICPLKPVNFHAVGLWYSDFSQTTDKEVTDLLARAHEHYIAEISTER